MQQRCIPTKKSNNFNDFYLLCSAFAYPYGTFAFVEWAKMNGYNTSTYLGQPIVKFTKLYIRIERRDGSQQSSGLSNVRKS